MFRGLLSSVLLVGRIIVMFKFIMLLWLTFYPKDNPTSILTWWVYYMIFDMWMVLMLPSEEVLPYDENED